METKISNVEINAIVQAALTKKSTEEPRENIEASFHFGGKDHDLQFIRRYHRGHVSLCIPATCDAGDNCCHHRIVDGIELCYTGSDDFDLLNSNGEGVIINNIDEQTDTKIFRAVSHVLTLISEQSPKK